MERAPHEDQEYFALSPEETILRLFNYYFPPYITLASRFDFLHGEEELYRNRRLKQYLLEYVEDGSADFMLGEKPMPVKQGDLFLIRPDHPHTIHGKAGSPYKCISILFHFGQSKNFPLSDLLPKETYLGTIRGLPLEDQLHQLVHNYQDPHWVNQLRCQHILIGILLQLLTSAAPFALNQTRSGARVELARRYLEQHYAENITLEQLESVSELSRNYLLSKFKQFYNLSPMKYLRWIRIQRAKELAANTSLSVNEIAIRVGYADVHTFGRMFKAETGMSLTQFSSSIK
ncbi:helix-turn-helix domain-containing protein [Paenibacillus rigui]|uniref:helix-turn-helix domain-containing protein n=1 Tax=Paenibacillus rigui TaxID=554312 RepID=UPI0015C5E417|nr:helix-turn-helix domain-containing protein [Paenibacillus rigui]